MLTPMLNEQEHFLSALLKSFAAHPPGGAARLVRSKPARRLPLFGGIAIRPAEGDSIQRQPVGLP